MARPQVRIWWLNPGWTFAVASLPFAIAAYLIPNREYVLNWRTNRFFDGSDVIFCAECLLAFLAGGILAACLQRKKPLPEWGKFTVPQLNLLMLFFKWGFGVVLAAYGIWIMLAAHHGISLSMLKEEFTGEGGASYEIKENAGTWPGITTAAQFAPALFIIGSILYFNGRKKVLPWLIGLLFVTLLRSVAYSERLALTEVIIPTVVLTAYYNRDRFRRFFTGLPSVFWPMTALLLLYVLFTMTEYTRSWQAYSGEGTYSSVWPFALDRLLGYYVTALNNGSLAYHMLGQSELPMSSFDWLFRFPIIGSRIFMAFDPHIEMTYSDVLKSEANPEFNNNSGIFAYAMDWGEPGVYVFYFLFGAVVFATFFAFLRGAIGGLLLYPFLFTGLTEIARVPYLTTTRAFPALIGFAALLFCLWRVRRKQELRAREEAQLFPYQGSRARNAGTGAPPPVNGISEAPSAPTRK